MPVPKRKVSKRRRDQRSANKGVKPKSVAACLTCQEPLASHTVCKGCGYYKGVKVITTKTDRMYTRGQALEAREATVRAKSALQTEGKDSPSESES